jgi:ribosomal protein S18 acetylase RimI-like enzyme
MMIPTIRNATLEEIDFFLSLAKNEGWNPGLHDTLPFYSIDPSGFFISELNGKIIGCISVVAYNDAFGFLGFYIIIPEYRGRGWGLQMWNHAMKYLGSRCVGLDGVIAQQENYKKSHFQFYYRNIRFEGRGFSLSPTALTELNKIPFEMVLEYDLPIFGLARDVFLRRWIEMPNAYSLAKIEQDQLKGYGVIRQCVNGFKIGPLFADDLDIAKEIYAGLCGRAGDSPVFIDVPEVNPLALKLIHDAGLKTVFETARMYNKPPPEQQLNKVFGVTTFEVG